MKNIPIILLAAGQSRRMGGVDKLIQPINDVPLVRRTALRALAVGPVIIALPPAPHTRHTALDGLNVIKAEVDDAAEGMNASLRRAMTLVPETARAVMILLCDLPDLTSEDMAAVLAARKEHPDNLVWRGATQDGRPGHPVIFDRSLFHDLVQLSGDDGAQSVVKRCGGKVHLHPLPGQSALLDLDTPDDWKDWSKKTLTQKNTARS